MITLIINLSPRTKGTCAMLSGYFKDRIENEQNKVMVENLYMKLKDISQLLDQVEKADTIVMIGPCYVDTYPADTIYLLEQMSKQEGVLHGQKLYGFIQGGMPYVHTHESGLKLLDNFADKNNIQWMGGFVMGGGAMLDGKSLEHLPNAKTMVPAVNTFIEHIAQGEPSPDELYKEAASKIPFLMAVFLVNMLNGMLKKKFKEKGINYKVPSPYLQ